MSLSNTIVAGNINAGAPDLRSNSGTFTTSGYNLIGDNSTVTATFPAGIPNGNNDYAGTNATPLNAALLVLGGNGGPTPTHALLACSPAVNAGTNVGAPATDQRGVARPLPGGTDPDIGAFQHPWLQVQDGLDYIASYRDLINNIGASAAYLIALHADKIIVGKKPPAA